MGIWLQESLFKGVRLYYVYGRRTLGGGAPAKDKHHEWGRVLYASAQPATGLPFRAHCPAEHDRQQSAGPDPLLLRRLRTARPVPRILHVDAGKGRLLRAHAPTVSVTVRCAKRARVRGGGCSMGQFVLVEGRQRCLPRTVGRDSRS